MADDNGNPFDTPLGSEVDDHQQQQAATVQASDNGNPFSEPLLSEKAEAQATGSDTGTVKNDVGNNVIVPKDGESFADTMKRAAASGATVTQEQIDKGLATAPKKTAEVLAAAPALGFGGASALAGVGEGTAVLKHIASTYGPQAVKAIGEAAEAHPVVAKLLTHALEVAGGVSLIKLYKLLDH